MVTNAFPEVCGSLNQHLTRCPSAAADFVTFMYKMFCADINAYSPVSSPFTVEREHLNMEFGLLMLAERFIFTSFP